jgi:acetyltransferase-like isoleucine patch superfamily enzyme
MNKSIITVLFKNPFSLWLKWGASACYLLTRNKTLKLGYMATVKECIIGQFNAVYDHSRLHKVKLGDYSYVANSTVITNTNIGKFCSIGPNCLIGLGKHPSNTFVSTHPAFFSTSAQCGISFVKETTFNESELITIANDVWLGANVTICDGVSIGNGAIIAAGTVVTKDVEAYSIVGGVPAKLIKMRFTPDQIEGLDKSKWWAQDISNFTSDNTNFKNIKQFLEQFER